MWHRFCRRPVERWSSTAADAQSSGEIFDSTDVWMRIVAAGGRARTADEFKALGNVAGAPVDPNITLARGVPPT